VSTPDGEDHDLSAVTGDIDGASVGTGGAPPSQDRLPEHPVVFCAAANTAVSPYDDLLLPCGADATGWEVELIVSPPRRRA
ncbi:hypothetical protein JYK22_32425, partial [Nonomuraea sp. RK-328]|nr:hypothetical protein [Nonomuraea sp. RK-328]